MSRGRESNRDRFRIQPDEGHSRVVVPGSDIVYRRSSRWFLQRWEQSGRNDTHCSGRQADTVEHRISDKSMDRRRRPSLCIRDQHTDHYMLLPRNEGPSMRPLRSTVHHQGMVARMESYTRRYQGRILGRTARNKGRETAGPGSRWLGRRQHCGTRLL